MNILKSHLGSVVAISLLASILSPACIKINREPHETKLGSHRVRIRPDCQSVSTRSHRRSEQDGTSRILFYELKCGDTAILIQDNTLKVNGKSYGTLNEGDEIAVDYGKVRVNLSVRPEVR